MIETTDKVTTTDICQDYDKGISYLQSKNIFDRSRECFSMTLGDQWSGLQYGQDRPTQLNILFPIMKQSTALVGQNTMCINYSSMNYDTEQRETFVELCDKLNKHASKQWERLKMDNLCWNVLQESFIVGDSFAYFYDKDGKTAVELLDNTQVLFADEQNPNIQEQPYILIHQRRYVKDIIEEAKANKISKKDIEFIVSDEDTQHEFQTVEVKNDKKCVSIMKLWKEKGTIHIAKSVMNAIYQTDTVIEGMTLYPIAKYSWKIEKGTARGLGDIWDKIPNQIAINKAQYRFEYAIKNSAFPHKIYNKNLIDADQVAALQYPDSNIGVSDNQSMGVDKIVSYMQPANISPFAKGIIDDTIKMTRELSGAGDNLENINPEQASGASITAARDAKALNVNMQVAAYKQFIEDIAAIWFDMWVTYNPNGLEIVTDSTDDAGVETQGLEKISVEQLKALKIDIRVDVSPSNPYSKMAQDISLKELFQSQAITFDEYVKALADDSIMPKSKLESIIADRKALAEKQMQEQQAIQAQQVNMPQIPQEMPRGMDGGIPIDTRQQEIAQLQAMQQQPQ